MMMLRCERADKICPTSEEKRAVKRRKKSIPHRKKKNAKEFF
jgi:hypothetical protein